MPELKALRIKVAGQDAETQLLTALKQVGLSNICYAYKSRVKGDSELVEKLNRKLPEKPDYHLESITDVVGLRIVTLFRQDMLSVVEKILSLINHEEDLAPNPFVKGKLTEAIIYSTDLLHDSVANELKLTIPRTGLIDKVEVNYSEARYSSIHLLGQLNVAVEDMPTDYRIPIEIQVRTVFEDAWGEIDHQYGYQRRRANDDSVRQPSPQLKSHLLTLKKFVDACAEYADVIQEDATGSFERQKIDKVIPLASDELIEQNLREIGVLDEYIQRYLAIRSQKHLATTGNLSTDERLATYLDTAQKFSSMLTEAGDLENYFRDGSDASKLLYYYIAMGEALCKLSTRERAYIEDAATIYLKLKGKYAIYPVVRFRLGQAFSLLNRHEEALEIFRKCRRSISKVKNFPADRRRYTLPDSDLNHILIGLPKLTGITYWRMAEAAADQGEFHKAVQYLEQAYVKTEAALDHTQDQETLSIYNNLLYYAVELEKICVEATLPRAGQFHDRIDSCLGYVEQHLDIASTTETRTLDTLSFAYQFLDKPEKARTAAERLCAVMANQVSEGNKSLDEGEAFILNRAQEFLRSLA